MYETVDNSIVTAVFVAIITQQQDEAQVKEYLDELQFLALTGGEAFHPAAGPSQSEDLYRSR